MTTSGIGPVVVAHEESKFPLSMAIDNGTRAPVSSSSRVLGNVENELTKRKGGIKQMKKIVRYKAVNYISS